MSSQKMHDANEVYRTVLGDVMREGAEISAAESLSVGSKRKFKEILNYNLTLTNPVQRLLSEGPTFNLPGAIARFVWMMAANNRLADIEFYWGMKVSAFSDDDFTVPGSSYGARMFNASPGLDQIEAIIKRLKTDNSTRRAAVSIYHPIDAIRDSKDIPCTFGVFFHIRQEHLISTVVMRSNNAFVLLPYNIFEFSLLSEIIANEVGVAIGSMNYNVMSMHVYEENFEIVNQILSNREVKVLNKFPPMPKYPSPMEEVKKLIRLESKIRHSSAGITNANIDEWLQDTITIGPRENDKIALHDYWKQFYYLLLYFIVAKKTVDNDALAKVTRLIQEPYSELLNLETNSQLPKSVQIDLFGNLSAGIDLTVQNFFTRKLLSLEKMCKEHNKSTDNGAGINFEQYISLRQSLVGEIDDIRKIAARGGSPEIDKTDFLQALKKVTDGAG